MINKEDVYRSTIESDQHSYKHSPTSVLLATGATVGTASVAGVIFRKLPTGISRDKLTYLQGFRIGSQRLTDITAKHFGSTATVGEVILNYIKAAEELLFRIPRTFSASSLYSSSLLRDISVELSYEMLRPHEKYLRTISKGRITAQHIKEGLIYSKGKLYTKDGKEILKHARIFLHEWDILKDTPYEAQSSILSKYKYKFTSNLYRQHGFVPPKSNFVLTGGQNIFSVINEYIGSYLTTVSQNYFRLLDDPGEFVLSILETAFGKSKTLQSIYQQYQNHYITRKITQIYGLFKNKFGVGGQLYLEGNYIDLWKRHLRYGFPRILVAAGAIYGLNEISRKIFDTSLVGLAAKAYQKISLGLNYVSDVTGLTDLNKWQREKGGPSNLLQVAAIPLSFGILGATIGKGYELFSSTPIGLKGKSPLYNLFAKLEKQSGLIGKAARKIELSKLGSVGAFFTVGAALGAALTLPFIPGAIGAGQTTEELKDIYSGKELVPIRKGRFWEFGISPYSGENIEGYAPHWTVRYATDARAKNIYTDEYYGKPIKRIISRIFDPYYLERLHDKDRPYVYWGPSDKGLGLLEKLARPLKEAFKPTVLAHPEVIEEYGSSRQIDPGANKKVPSLGTLHIPVKAPDDIRNIIGDIVRSAEESGGLQTYMLSSLAEKYGISVSDIYPEYTWASSGNILSAKRAWEDTGLGGAFTLSEPLRRMINKKPYGADELHAPIRNTMPHWLPTKYEYGDPYAKSVVGEYMLPGSGYETLYPELKGVPYSKYPDIHKLNILSAVAPESPEYYKILHKVQRQIAEGELSADEIKMFNYIVKRHDEYFEDKPYTEEPTSFLGKYWMALKKAARSLPTESLYPFSPTHKFAGPVDVIAEYKSKEVLDQTHKMWHQPLEKFIKPAINKTIDLGASAYSTITGDQAVFVPEEKQTRDYINSYFDYLQYLKNQRISKIINIFTEIGDYQTATKYKQYLKPTLIGTPLSENIEVIKSRMPQREAKYLEGFIQVTDPKKRAQILQMVQPETAQVLKAYWTGDYSGTIQPGYNFTEEDVPPPDWTGWAPEVELSALKVKTVNNLGQNIREYGLWKEDERKAMAHDAILREAGRYDDVSEGMYLYEKNMKERIKLDFNASNAIVNDINLVPGNSMIINVNYRDNDRERLKAMFRLYEIQRLIQKQTERDRSIE